MEYRWTHIIRVLKEIQNLFELHWLFRPNFVKNKQGMCLHDVEYCTYYRRASVRATIIWRCKIVVIESLSKLMSFLQKSRTTDWNVVTNKASFNFSYVPVFILSFQWWILKNFKDFFSVFFPGILNWFAAHLLGLPFSSSFNASYFTFKVTSWCFLLSTFLLRQPPTIEFKQI